MADFSRSSFIPKETSGSVPGRVRRRRTFHIVGFVATTMLIGSLALAGGVYFLESSAQNARTDAKTALNQQKDLFKAESIAEVREFDRRLKGAELLIQNHISPLRIFEALEEQTKQKVQFTSFLMEHTPTFEVLLTLQGTTPEFRSLALQEIQFGETAILKDIVFNEVATSDGEARESGASPAGSAVTFTLKGTLDPSTIAYEGITPNAKISAETEALFTSAVLGDSITTE